MTENKLNEEYFNWICRLVQDTPHGSVSSYRNLLLYLHNIDFQYSLPMDGNRADDGINLRYRFGYEEDIDFSVIACYLDNRPCSVLEMMAALSLRCEENIMQDPEFGNRTEEWFWSMIESLGLIGMDDINFSPDFVENVIFDFMNHNYSRNGKGGLFTIKDNRCDMRNVEIWYQLNWYLDSIICDRKEQ